uniref:Putative glutathione s-transferase-related protein n=1 Tax=Corethrella appendiculata TaxID=1370023 RepID=U5EGP9_9DIPT
MTTYKLCSLTRNLTRFPITNYNTVNKSINFRYFASQIPKSKPSTLKLGLKGVALGTLLGTGYSGYLFFTDTSAKDHLVHQKRGPEYLDTLPNVRITKRIVNENDKSGLELILFQFQTCPFCCKVRAFLDFNGISYSIVEVDAVLRQDIKWSKSKKVPTLLAKTKDGRYVQLSDSSTIISVISSYLIDKRQDIGELVKLYPAISYFDDNGKKAFDIMNKYFLMFGDHKPKDSKDVMNDERKWRAWADSHLVHLISPNVYRTKDEALETFEWFSDVGEWGVHFPQWERNLMVYGGAFAMWAIAKRLKKRYDLDDVRVSIYDACNSWIDAIEKKKTTFIGGNEPNLADLAVFGVLSSMEGCQAFKDVCENTKIGK